MSVDVVLPVFDGERFLRRAVESVLAQEGAEDLTIWCVDDCSRDRSPELLAALAAQDRRVRVLTNAARRGVAATRNVGIGAGSAEFIAFIDQDDRWVDGKLARQLEYLRDRYELGYVVGHQEFALEPGVTAPAWVRSEWWSRPQPGYLPSALLLRRQTFERVGPLDERFRAGGDDTDWFARARRLGVSEVLMPETVFVRGIHESNLSSDPQTSDEVLKLVRSHLSSQAGTA